MGHNSRQGYFLGQELLLDFAAWIDLTSNADNSLISRSCVLSYRTHFASLKHVDDLRVYQGFMMPFNHQAGYKVLVLKILGDRAVMLHISVLGKWYVL